MSTSAPNAPPIDVSLYPGHWIAWNEDQTEVVAVADTFPELMVKVDELGLSDLEIEIAPGIHPIAAARPFTLLSCESPDILDDIRKTIPDAEYWLDQPNTRMGMKTPRELIGTDQEVWIRDLLRGIWGGITS